jgi:AcrR family transcriptional regulator
MTKSVPKATPKRAAGPATPTGPRDRILDAAVALLAESGFEALTTRAVATRAGVNQGLVHYHFGTMARLRVRAVVSVFEREMAVLIDGMNATDDLSVMLRDLFAWMRTFDPQSVSSRVGIEAMVEAMRDPDLGRELDQLLEQLRGAYTAAIERSIANGSTRPVDARAVAVLVAALVDGLLIHRLLAPDLDLDAVGRVLVELLAPGGDA